ncbi:MAG TPA: ribose 5-phosphate isomerase B [Streptosporangiaceae bacterium]|jgi:ribose 5-phosphate isomerase B|nr:ribose 5-phosphate isomerase B [Streptosporangiaceae bacterium]
MRIAIASDHNGLDLKAQLTGWLSEHGHEVDDRGTHGTETVDYPPLCADVGRQVTGGHADRGIVLGGSGSGEQMACNKIRGVRAGVCHELFTARIARANNDANVLIIGAKIVAPALAELITELWLNTPFTGGPHQRRLDQIAALEQGLH